jgi:hypothetical protein
MRVECIPEINYPGIYFRQLEKEDLQSWYRAICPLKKYTRTQAGILVPLKIWTHYIWNISLIAETLLYV